MYLKFSKIVFIKQICFNNNLFAQELRDCINDQTKQSPTYSNLIFLISDVLLCVLPLYYMFHS